MPAAAGSAFLIIHAALEPVEESVTLAVACAGGATAQGGLVVVVRAQQMPVYKEEDIGKRVVGGDSFHSLYQGPCQSLALSRVGPPPQGTCCSGCFACDARGNIRVWDDSGSCVTKRGWPRVEHRYKPRRVQHLTMEIVDINAFHR